MENCFYLGVVLKSSIMSAMDPFKNVDKLSGKVLLHFLIFGPDTLKLMGKRLLGKETNIDPSVIKEVRAGLCEMGLVKRRNGKVLPKRSPISSIKPWIKIKVKAKETAKHGQYFELTKEGKKVAKMLKNPQE